MIDSKLTVFRKFEDNIKSGNIFLHHAFEDFEKISKLSAQKKLAWFRNMVEVLSRSIPGQEIPNIIEEAANRALSSHNIRELCFDVVIDDKGKNVGTVANSPYRCYSMITIRRLKENLSDKTLHKIYESLGSEICIGISKHIQTTVKVKLKQDPISVRFKLSQKAFASFSLFLSSFLISVYNPLFGLLLAVVAVFVTLWWSVDVNSKEWRKKIADEIYDKIQEKRLAMLEKVQPEIESLCRKASTDLDRVSKQIKEVEEAIEAIPLEQCKLCAIIYTFVFIC